MIDLLSPLCSKRATVNLAIGLLSSEQHGRYPLDSKNFLETILKYDLNQNNLCIISLVILLVYAGLDSALGSTGKQTNVSINEGRVQRQ